MPKPDMLQINKALTMNGSIPAGYAFLCYCQIYIWNPHNHLSVLLIEDNEIYQACVKYLSTFQNCASLQEAKAKIIAEKWQGWEKLLKPFDPDAE